MGSFSVSWQRTSREFLALAAICLHFSLVANAFPLPRAPWAASEYPDPRIEPSQCRVPQRAGLIICDPEELFAASVRADEYTRADRVFRVFSDEFGTHFGEHWGSSVGIALLQETSAALEPFADQLSQQWGLNKPGDVLLVLRLGSSPRATLAGGFLYEEATSESTWRAAAEDRASLLLRAGRLADAIEAGLSGASEALGGDALEAVQRPRAPMRLFKGHSDYQLVEVEETICGGRRCRQFILDHQVQLSDRFERYFHEAMTMVALNALGANGKRVLVIGGGDGGISTLAVRYSFVQKVVVVDIDEMVTNTSQRWFPTVSSGLSDKRTQLVRTDAIEWVKTCQDVFDLIVVDFTQEPLESFWSVPIFQEIKRLLSPHGVLMHSVGTMNAAAELKNKFSLHAAVFSKVYPLSVYAPDYNSPYVLAFSTDSLDPFDVDWTLWQTQGITPTYYSPALHRALFALPTEISRALDLQVPVQPATLPQPLTAPPSAQEAGGPRPMSEKVLDRAKTAYNALKVVQWRPEDSICEGPNKTCMELLINTDTVLGHFAAYRDEVMTLPALNLLGSSAKRVLVLGGGPGGIASLALKFPSVESVVVLEIDAQVVDMARRWFPEETQCFSDPRVTVVIGDAATWLSDITEKFDLVLVSLSDQAWLKPHRATRLPRTFRFHRKLKSILNPHGVLVQEIGSVSSPQNVQRMMALHRAVYQSVWPLVFASNDDELDDKEERRIRQAPRMLALSSAGELRPFAVDWRMWESLGLRTKFYNPMIHEALFILPAELQRSLMAEPPAATELGGDRVGSVTRRQTVALGESDSAKSQPLLTPRSQFEVNKSLEESALVFGFFMEANGCSFTALNDTAGAVALLEDLAELGHLTYVSGLHHQFLPQGLTALLLVEESHLSIHTWPELGYAVLDIVSCKAMNEQTRKSFLEATRARLGCKDVVAELGLRGHGHARDGGFKPALSVDNHSKLSAAEGSAAEDGGIATKPRAEEL